jgi:hypothetical protein
MESHCVRFLAILVASLALTGCGITVPNIKEIWDTDKPANVAPVTPDKVPGTAQIEFEIKRRIYCDLKRAVQRVNRIPFKSGPPGKLTVTRKGLIPENWGAQVSLSLQVDEVSGLNPGLTLTQLMPNAVKIFGPGNTVTTPQSFGLGFGATLSSTATRIDKYDPFYPIPFLMIPDNPRTSICFDENDPLMKDGWRPASSSPFILESDLGIEDWLLGAMEVDDALPSIGGGGAPAKDTVSYEVKFVIVSSGSVTPTWKLVRVSANSGASPFFNVGRTRTHDLIITIGGPSQQTANTHLASQIGNSVSNANRAIFTSPPVAPPVSSTISLPVSQ